MTRTTTHEEAALHLRDIRSSLSNMGWNLMMMAEAVGVRKQTFSQYCMMPGTNGARMIPADRLDVLRAIATEERMKAIDEGFPKFLPREEHLWEARDGKLAMALLFETTSPWRAMWASARTGGEARPAPSNTVNPRFGETVTPESALCINWVRYASRGRVTREEACAIAGVDEYLIERVGHEFPIWRIQPTLEQVEEIADLHDRRETAVIRDAVDALHAA